MCTYRQTVTCSVFQSSTLDPLSFLFYINDLPENANFAVKLYIDDIALIMKHNNIVKQQENVNSVIKRD